MLRGKGIPRVISVVSCQAGKGHIPLNMCIYTHLYVLRIMCIPYVLSIFGVVIVFTLAFWGYVDSESLQYLVS